MIYLYAMLEAEARIALLAVGLDPGLGVLHADLKARDSLALDLMEAARPRVDEYVLRLLRSHAFAARDFFETRQGACRVLPPLTHRLAETAPAWAKAAGGAAAVATPTPLTGANRRAGRATLRTRTKGPVAPEPAALPVTCGGCGVVLGDPGRAWCDGCLPERRAEQAAGFVKAGAQALAGLRAGGTDPAHGGEAGRKRGGRNAAHTAANAAWEERQPGHGLDFARDVLPRLRAVPVRAMAKATGLSEGYCSLVRRGLKVPHRRHWAVLAELGAADPRRAAGR